MAIAHIMCATDLNILENSSTHYIIILLAIAKWTENSLHYQNISMKNPCNIKMLNFIRTYDVHSSEYSKEPTHNQNQYGKKVTKEQHNIHLNAVK